MKSIIFTFFIFLLVLPQNNHAQNAKTKALMKEIEGKWEVDDNDQVTYIRIIEADSVSRDEIFTRALGYFTYNYNSGEDVIQVNNRDAGTIIAKGLYANIKYGFVLFVSGVETWHVLRIDVKDRRARVILSLTRYRVNVNTGEYGESFSNNKISNYYPINPSAGSKNAFAVSFYDSHHRAINTLNELEKTIKEGSTSRRIEDNW